MLPILTECSTKKAEGYRFLKGGGHQPVRSVPLQVLLRWQKSRELVEGDYGTVSSRAHVVLLALTRLLQAVQSKGTGDLAAYVKLKASEEVQHEHHSPTRLGGLRPKESRTGFFATSDDLSIKFKMALQQESVRGRLKAPGSRIGEEIRELSWKAQPAKLVLWWVKEDSRVAAGLYCPSFETALYALLLLHAATPEGMAVCAGCTKVFRRVRIKQMFCSKRCGNTIRQRRHRSAQRI
jgi:hypothetical protein